MSERVKFVGRLLDGEKMVDLCKDFGISRKTGYKIFNRYKSEGLVGLNNKSTLPYNRPNKTPTEVENLITQLRELHKTWGAPKIKEYLSRKHPDLVIPAKSTIHAILERNKLIQKKRRNKKYKAQGTMLERPLKSNDLWCADFKGQFRLKNRKYCYPLTITDPWSRYIISCEALESTKETETIPVFERAFREYGLPSKIRTDNGVPFATRSIFGLSVLSVWWLRLGIKIERIQPGHPEQNGTHERMHRTLKQTAISPDTYNLLQQQERFDDFVHVFNDQRPHQGIGMKCPSDLYKKSSSKYPDKIEELQYPEHDKSVLVNVCGTIRLSKFEKVYISSVFKHNHVGLTEVDDNIWKVSFMNYDLGFFDRETLKFVPGENPFLVNS
jgi:transposase InsO family protein